MNGLLLLLYCIEIVGATHATAGLGTSTGLDSQYDYSKSTSPVSQTTSVTDLTSMSEASSLMSSSSRRTSPSPGPQLTTTTTTILNNMFNSKECRPVLTVAGGLIIACTILLVSTLILACKVCQLSRHIKVLSSNSDLISNSEYWVGSGKKNKSKSETEAKETTVLMTEISQTQEETGNGTTKEEGGKVNEDGKMGEEKKKEVVDTANSEEASTTPVTVAENASSSKPQEEATDSQSTKAVAASSSEGTEEPKDVV